MGERTDLDALLSAGLVASTAMLGEFMLTFDKCVRMLPKDPGAADYVAGLFYKHLIVRMAESRPVQVPRSLGHRHLPSTRSSCSWAKLPSSRNRRPDRQPKRISLPQPNCWHCTERN